MRISDWSSDVCSSDLIGETGWPICCVAQTAALVFFIGFKIALEPFHMTIAFKGEDVGGKTVEEEAVMADDHGAARIVFESVFQGTQRFEVKVIGRLVEQEDIAADGKSVGEGKGVSVRLDIGGGGI